ncbi:beta-glucoside-specific PTS transporter subunit IIABC [Candidatus Enterococcus ferrettii]|uniref:PTS system, beta-glucoside-specific IIA component n=1 Tax=Candidatus Enterococcus ferrettii TaxID=2815324 RepID=A0ABV0EM59_9ENTE|nr:beta-glucoside-specific PTS transporter subunit IIABC [Enterococcus sp. 665A]MBO1338264.1 PTS glucose transporter subunit IIA [Enterococcus sp. 665A]
MSKREDFAKFIVENVGGEENIMSLTHCVTRLRFTLKDSGMINEEALKSAKGIVTAQESGGQYQVVIGTHVAEVYNDILSISNIASSNGNDKKDGILNSVIQIITKVITPALGPMIACGLIQGLLNIMTFAGVIEITDGSYLIIHAMGQAIFQFFPVILGYTSAKAFKLDPTIGIFLGAILMFPNLAASLNEGEIANVLFTGTFLETAVYNDFFGIPIIFPKMGYGSTVIPIIFIVFFASKLSNFLNERIPKVVAFTLVPFLTVVITAPLAILIIGPVTDVLSSFIGYAVESLYTISPIITSFLLALVYQPIVILGLHWPLIAIAIQNISTTGSDFIGPILYTGSFAQTAVVMAVYFRTKSQLTKQISLPAIVSGFFAIIEPAIYGITLPVKKRFGISMLAAAVGSVIFTAFKVRKYGLGSGIFGFMSFTKPDGDMSGVIISLIACGVTMIVGFVLTAITFSENPNDILAEEIKEQPATALGEVVIYSPMKGRVVPLADARDSAFANEALGKGILVYPEGNKVVAPFDGRITTLFPSEHAVGFTSNEGIELLIHIGKDTVRLNGKYFKAFKKQGDYVKKGESILEFDISKIVKEGLTVETPIVITNSDSYKDILMTINESIDYGQEIISVEKRQKMDAAENLPILESEGGNS